MENRDDDPAEFETYAQPSDGFDMGLILSLSMMIFSSSKSGSTTQKGLKTIRLVGARLGKSGAICTAICTAASRPSDHHYTILNPARPVLTKLVGCTIG